MIPIILGAAALATAGYGVLKGAEGTSNIFHAQEIGELAESTYKVAITGLEKDREKTNQLASNYGKLQLQIASITVRRFVDFIERTGRKASQSEQEFLSSFDLSMQQLNQYKAVVINAESTLGGVVMAGAAASAAYSGVLGVATSVGVASTGAAISGLSGAAATNATLAWLGGGALSAGGGGMALGSLVLGGITVGPALAIGGFVLAGQGEVALTKAMRYKAKVHEAIEKILSIHEVFQQIKNRINELSNLLKNINERSLELLDDLESHNFDPQQDAQMFQQVALMIKALVEIMKVPILTENGDLNTATATLIVNYSRI